MKRLLCATLMLTMTSWCGAQPRRIAPQEVWDRIVDDDPNPLSPLPNALLAPPTGATWTPGGYAPAHGALVRWGSDNSLLTQFIVGITDASADPPGDSLAFVLVSGSSRQQGCAAPLEAAGARWARRSGRMSGIHGMRGRFHLNRAASCGRMLEGPGNGKFRLIAGGAFLENHPTDAGGRRGSVDQHNDEIH